MNEASKSMDPKSPDGGYGWVIVTACSLGFCLVGSVVFTMTVMYQALLERFEMDAADTGSLGATLGTTLLIFCPIINELNKYLGLRTMVMLSGILFCLGLVLCAFSAHPAMVTVGYGIITGFAMGVYNFCVFVIIDDYFNNKRSFAIGICLCGAGVGGLVTPPLLEMCFNVYGFTGAIMLQAGIFLNLIPVGMLLRPVAKTCNQNIKIEQRQIERSSPSSGIAPVEEVCIHPEHSNVVTIKKETEKENFWQKTGLYHMRSPLFVTYSLLMCSYRISFFCTSIYMSGLAIEKCHLTRIEIATVLSAASIVDIVAKIASGFILDTKYVNKRRPYVFVGLKLFNCVIGFIIASVVYDFVTMTVAWSVFFVSQQMFYMQMSVILSDITGPEGFSSALGLSRFAQGLSVFPGIRITGFLTDWLLSYSYVFYFCSAFDVVTATMFLIVNYWKTK